MKIYTYRLDVLVKWNLGEEWKNLSENLREDACGPLEETKKVLAHSEIEAQALIEEYAARMGVYVSHASDYKYKCVLVGETELDRGMVL